MNSWTTSAPTEGCSCGVAAFVKGYRAIAGEPRPGRSGLGPSVPVVAVATVKLRGNVCSW